MFISLSVLFRMRNFSEEGCRENHNTHFMFINFFFNHAVYEIMYKNILKLDRPQMIIRCMHVACWITKGTNTLRICNTYDFSTPLMVALTCLSVT